MGLRLTGLLGGLATACALAARLVRRREDGRDGTEEAGSPRVEKALSCVEDQGYDTDLRPVTAAARRDGTTGILSVLLDLEGGSAIDNVVDLRFWSSSENAARYVKEVGDGPLGDLHHEQLGTVTITYTHHEHGAEEEHETHAAVDGIAACVA